MSPRRRIVLNILVTYGRSLYGTALGLFTARWALHALGQTDYGLFGLVGGLTGFVAFFSDLLSSSVGRFYAVIVGASVKAADADKGVDECRKWFNTALLLHMSVSLVLMLVGYPVGEYVVRHFLTIPPNRIEACVWVWRFTCVSCFVGMVSVPFSAMYTAKQEIAELTIYGFVASTLNVIVLYYMISTPGVWLTGYALWMMVLGVGPQFIIGFRAIVKYQECRFVCAYLYDVNRIMQIVSYAFARFWTALSGMVSAQGNAILVNKYLGPAFNASMTMGNTVASRASSLSASLSGAFWPAIANKAGEGDEESVRQFSFRTCRLGALMVLVFAIPLALEIDEVMLLWLKDPPALVSMICVTMLLDTVLERMSEGYWMAIMSLGRGVGTYSAWVSISGLSSFVLAWVALACGMGFEGICLAIILMRVIAIAVRLILGKKLVGMSAGIWLREVFVPITCVSLIVLSLGSFVKCMCHQSFMRLCVTTLFSWVTFGLLAWKFVLTTRERSVLSRKFKKKIS